MNAASRQEGQAGGTARVRLTVDAKGAVIRVEILSTTDKALGNLLTTCLSGLASKARPSGAATGTYEITVRAP